jgi:hypothetical protein
MAFRLRSAGWATALAALTCVSIPVAQAQSSSPITKEECQKLYDSVAGKLVSALDNIIPKLEKMNNSWDNAIPRFRERLKTSAEIAKQAGEGSVRALRRLRSTLENLGTELQMCVQQSGPVAAPVQNLPTVSRQPSELSTGVQNKIEKDAATMLRKIEEQVAIDALAQYQIVARHGSAVDRCVHAGLVSAALVQAKKEEEYKQWKMQETADCRAAGMP